MDLSRYNKFIVALVAAAGILAVACAPTDKEVAFHVTANEWYQVFVAFLGALGVYSIPNKGVK